MSCPERFRLPEPLRRQRRPAAQVHEEDVRRLALAIDAGQLADRHCGSDDEPGATREHGELPVRRLHYGNAYGHNDLFFLSRLSRNQTLSESE